jgi:hypothetical protein
MDIFAPKKAQQKHDFVMSFANGYASMVDAIDRTVRI